MTSTPAHAAKAAEVIDHIRSGSIANCDMATLVRYSAWLSEQSTMDAINNSAVFEQSCELVRLHMLRAMIEGFESRSKTMQWWVVVLAVAALVTSIVQTVVAIRAEMRATTEAGSASRAASTSLNPAAAK